MRIWNKLKTKWNEYRFRRRLETAELSFPVFCKLRGVKNPDYQGAIIQSRVGDLLQLVHTPSPQAYNRVYAYSITLHRILGYLHESLAERLIYVFGKDFCRDGVIENITGETNETRGCNIRILTTAEAFLPK